MCVFTVSKALSIHIIRLTIMKKYFLLIQAFLLGATACDLQPESGDLAKDMVVQTRYDEPSISELFNVFTTYSTFIIREDTIGFVSNTSSDTVLIDGVNMSIPNGYVTPVVERVKEKLSGAGFQQVTDENDPDFAVNIAVLDNFSFFQTINYPGYYSGYYSYYGYYYPIVQTYYSNYATMVIEIVDIKNYALNGNRYKVIWKASIGDLYTTFDLRGKTLEAIDQAFIQSPYIQNN